MQHSNDHYQFATLAHKVLNTLSSAKLAVHGNYLRYSVGEVESMADLKESQFYSELQRLVACGFVIERKKSAVYQITEKGMRMKRIMNKLRNS